MFEPIIDKEYSDAEIEVLYQDMLDKHVAEEKELYDEPPFLDLDEWMNDFPREEFDPDDYLIADIDENGEEFNHRKPESYDQMLEFLKREYEHEWAEYENRDEFDEEEAAEEFEEEYRDNLEEPDEDIPKWVRDSVDKRLLAMYLLPESVYKKLKEEEEEKQIRFDELDELADRLEEEREESFPVEYEYISDYLDEVQLDYILDAAEKDGDYVIEFAGWDEEEETVRKWLVFEAAEMIENEEPVIHVETDEDGDIESDCELLDSELYYEDGRFEVHLLLDNEKYGLKYVTLKCDNIDFE
jgi:hypothetical protein